jgi:nitroimidazol reductase NimA-like FMN-containing flavoprotein (pyridoxamine 5'-phosphate oxidase superfamily)
MEAPHAPDSAASEADAHVDLGAGDPGVTEVLDVEQCWALLASAEVGRLAVAAAGDIDIFPINFTLDDGTVLFRSAEGTKLIEVVMSGRVAFEVDGYEPDHGQAWSVVLKGVAKVLDRFDDIYHAQDLPLFPWNASPKERFVRIVPTKLTGRRFMVQQDRAGGVSAL